MWGRERALQKKRARARGERDRERQRESEKQIEKERKGASQKGKRVGREGEKKRVGD